MRSACLVALFLGFALPAQEPESPDPAAPATEAPARPQRQQQQQQQQEEPAESVFRRDHVADLAWRNLGPANPVGRVTDIAIPRQRKSTWYVGTGGGGVWKTENGGTTWENVFDRWGTVSIGDVEVAPSNPDIVWIGTGEENARNSVQWGDGVYKSVDGGKTWEHMGLRETFQIGHIAVHPENPDIVYVAALGRLWGENPERGIFRTRDGGYSWQKVFHLDDKTGCIDVRIDHHRPNVVYACAYERKRDIFCSNDPAVRFGEKSGLYRSDDGGDHWKPLQNGLPTNSKWGRSGLHLWETNPQTLFAIVETERSGWATGSRERGAAVPRGGAQPEIGERGSALMGIGEGQEAAAGQTGAVLVSVTEDGPAALAGLKAGDRITKVNDEAIKTNADLSELIRDSRSGEKVTITYVRLADDQVTQEEKTTELTWGRREAGFGGMGGNTLPNGGRLGGQNPNRQNLQGDDGWQTGGVYRSDDRGESWVRLNSLTERPFYYSVIVADPQDDQVLYSVGTTLWASFDGGKKFEGINRGIHVDFHAFWVDPDDGNHLIAGCDGGVNQSFDRGKTWQVFDNFCVAQYYKIAADNAVPYNVYGGLQDNGTWRGPSRTRNREGIVADDWFTFYGGDGFGATTDPLEPWIAFATSQNGGLGLVDMRSGNQARIQKGRPPDGGRASFNWNTPFFLSPHNRLTFYFAGSYAYRAERYAHLDQRDTRPGYGPVRDGMQGQVISGRLGLGENGTATAFAESPRVQGLLYVGTDDGALWRSDNGGDSWTELHRNLPGLLGPRHVSKIEPSHHSDNRVYVTLDGHRSDDLRPYVYRSDDRGATWTFLGDDIPATEPVLCIADDPRNGNLLFLGTEFGCWVSLDRGNRWLPLGTGLPTVAVRDIFVHDRDSDVVLGTHGRGVWTLDIEPLRQFTASAARKPAHLFRPEDAILWRMTSRGLSGNRDYRAPNPPYGAAIYLNLDAAPESAPEVTIHDVTGAQVGKLTGKARAGLQRLQWDGRSGNRLAAPGAYAARLRHGERTMTEAFQLLPDPQAADAGAAASPVREEK